MRVKKQLVSLVGGVSEAPDQQKLQNQCLESVNTSLHLSKGIHRRPPLHTVKKIAAHRPKNACFSHLIVRSETEQYICIIEEGELKVFDLKGNECKVNYAAGAKDYLASTAPERVFKAASMVDYTVIVNTERVCLMHKPELDHPIPVYADYRVIRLTDLPPNRTERHCHNQSKSIEYRAIVGEGDRTILVEERPSFIAKYKSYWYAPNNPAHILKIETHYDGGYHHESYIADAYWAGKVQPILFSHQAYYIEYHEGHDELPCRNRVNTEVPSKVRFLTKLADAITRLYKVPCEVRGANLYVKSDRPDIVIKDVSKTFSYDRDYYGGLYNHYTMEWLPSSFKGIEYNEIEHVLVGYQNNDGSIVPPEDILNDFGLICIRAVEYSTLYRVKINGAIVATAITPDEQAKAPTVAHLKGETLDDGVTPIGDDTSYISNHLTGLTTNGIAEKLHEQLIANTELSDTYIFDLSHNQILITAQKETTQFELECTDSQADMLCKGFKGTIEDAKELPEHSFLGVHFKVSPLNEDISAWYVIYQKDDSIDKQPRSLWATYSDQGYWVETYKQSIDSAFIPSTMPHQLVSKEKGVFSFEQCPFTDRKVGDQITAPDPSFVGNTINHALFWQERLVLLSDDAIIMSEHKEFYNFYRTTVKTAIATDAIDVRVIDTKVNKLTAAVAYNRNLIVFSRDFNRFIVSYASTLTPNTINIESLTSSAVASAQYPTFVADRVVYCGNNGEDNTSLVSYRANDLTRSDETTVLNSHCPSYLQGHPRGLITDGNHTTILLTDANYKIVYVNHYQSSGNTVVQNAFYRWQFDSDIMAMHYYRGRIYCVAARDTGTFLAYMDYRDQGVNLVSGSFAAPVYLDLKFEVAKGDVVPESINDMHNIAVDTTGRIYNRDTMQNLIKAGVAVKPFCFGTQYTSTHHFAPFYMYETSFSTPNIETKVQLTDAVIAAHDTSDFKVMVNYKHTAPIVYTVVGIKLNDPQYRPHQIDQMTAIKRVILQGFNADTTLTITSDSPNTFNITNLTWRGAYSTRENTLYQ